MGDFKLDDLIAVRVFRNGTEQELAYVEQGTVSDAKGLLDGKFHQQGSFQRGPLLLISERDWLSLGASIPTTSRTQVWCSPTGQRDHNSAFIPQAMFPKPCALLLLECVCLGAIWIV